MAADRTTEAVSNSPLPWHVGNEFEEHGRVEVWASVQGGAFKYRSMVASVIDVPPRDGHANAAFIVRAVNHHDALVTALAALVDAIDPHNVVQCAAWDAAIAVLAAVEQP